MNTTRQRANSHGAAIALDTVGRVCPGRWGAVALPGIGRSSAKGCRGLRQSWRGGGAALRDGWHGLLWPSWGVPLQSPRVFLFLQFHAGANSEKKGNRDSRWGFGPAVAAPGRTAVRSKRLDSMDAPARPRRSSSVTGRQEAAHSAFLAAGVLSTVLLGAKSPLQQTSHY